MNREVKVKSKHDYLIKRFIELPVSIITFEEISHAKVYINELQQENQSLKKQLEVGEEQYNNLVEEKENLQEQLSIKTLQLEEYKNQVDKGLYNVCLPYSTGYNKAIEEKENQQKEFIDYLENEKDRLARECSHIYENSLGKTRLVNEDIFNEVDTILSKYREIIGGKDK